MANALTLSASSMGRAPVPTGEGPTLLVDDANAVMIAVSPTPSTWDPEELALYRGAQRVLTPPMSDGTRWVLMGDDRFGVFQARARAAGVPVESSAVRVVPATVFLRPSPGAAIPTQTSVPARRWRPPSRPRPGNGSRRRPGLSPSPDAAIPGAQPALSSAAVQVLPPVAASPPPAQVRAARGAPARPPETPPTTAAGVAADQPRSTRRSPAAGTSRSPRRPRPQRPQPLSPPATSRPPAPHPHTSPAPTAPAPSPAPLAPSPTQGVVEVPLAEYDGRFAAVVAAIFSVITLTILAIVASQVIGDLIVATPLPVDSPTPDADSGARSGRATSALLIAVGSILLVAAAALAALDVRGRQRRVADMPTALRGTQPRSTRRRASWRTRAGSAPPWAC